MIQSTVGYNEPAVPTVIASWRRSESVFLERVTLHGSPWIDTCNSVQGNRVHETLLVDLVLAISRARHGCI